MCLCRRAEGGCMCAVCVCGSLFCARVCVCRLNENTQQSTQNNAPPPTLTNNAPTHSATARPLGAHARRRRRAGRRRGRPHARGLFDALARVRAAGARALLSARVRVCLLLRWLRADLRLLLAGPTAARGMHIITHPIQTTNSNAPNSNAKLKKNANT